MTKKALNELEKGEKETAVTAVVGRSNRSAHVSGTSFKFGNVKGYFIALLLIVITTVSTLFITGNLFEKESTFKQETTIYVEQIQELATLATTEAHLKTVIKQEDNKLFGKDLSVNLPGTKRELLLIVPATVIAGVDLKGITSQDFNVNEEEKVLEIFLPHAKLIQEPAIQMDGIETFSEEGLFRGEVKWDEGFDLAATAQEQIKEEAIEMGVLQKAEESAEKVLKGFLSNLGYTVELTYR